MSNVDPSSSPRRATLVLAAHGSQTEPLAAYQTHVHVQRLRGTGRFAQVRASFWKEAPEWYICLNDLPGEEVIVVPMLMSAGYFSKKILPTSLDIAARLANHQNVILTEPVGTHPALLDAAHTTLLDALEALSSQERNQGVRIIIAGHGTDRHRDSDASILALINHLRPLLPEDVQLTARFLDQEPPLAPLSRQERDEAPTTIVLPYFIASGQHTLLDIPEALGLTRTPDTSPYGVHDLGDATLHYLEPLGAQPAMIDVILARASEHTTSKQNSQTIEKKDNHNKKPSTSRSIPPPLDVSSSDAGWTLQTHEDIGKPHASLDVFTDPLAMWLALRSRSSTHASLPTALPLPTGWRLMCPDHDTLLNAIDLLFPDVVPQAERAEENRPAPLSLRALLERLGGNYARALLDDQAALRLDSRAPVDALCHHGCLKQRCWKLDDSDTPFPTLSTPSDTAPSCLAPCAALLTRLAGQFETT